MLSVQGNPYQLQTALGRPQVPQPGIQAPGCRNIRTSSPALATQTPPLAHLANILFGKKHKKKDPNHTVVILGGGLAGMTAAYLAQKNGLDAVVLESTQRLGGNAKTGYTKKGKRMSFPVGASVLGVANDQQRQFFKEIGIDVSDPSYKIHTDIALFDGQWVSIDPEKNPPELQKQPWVKEFTDGVRHFIQQLRTILRPRDGQTHFPLRGAPDEIFAWDKLDLKTFLDSFPEKVRKFFTVNLRSDISDDMDSISALAGIIDQGADQGERCLLPGGNFFVIKKMIQKIKSMGEQKVKFHTGTEVLEVIDTPDKAFATIKYRDGHGRKRTITAKHVLMGLPSTQIPKVMELPKETSELLSGIKRGAYGLMNIFLEEAPIESNTYFKFPDAKWVADVVLTNEKRDPELPAGSKARSVITCYIGIPTSLKDQVPSQDQLIQEVIEEMSKGFPWLKDKMKGTRLTMYKEAMSAPAPGQMEKLAEFDPQVGPRTQVIHSDISGIFAARGAVDGAIYAMERVISQQKEEKALAAKAKKA